MYYMKDYLYTPRVLSFFSGCLLLLTYLSGNAQTLASISENYPVGTVKGTVSSADGSPVEYVSVMLKGTTRGDITAADGKFQIKNIRGGHYTLVATYVGLQAQEKEITVIAGQITDADLVLPQNTQELNEIVITDKKSVNQKPVSIGKIAIAPLDLPQSVVTVEREILEQQQTLRLSEVLQNVNGMYQMGNTGGFQEEIASRGFALGSNNTFKNGGRFNNGVMPEISSLERVEVLKGSNAILFGNVAAGGVLNLVTKKPKFATGGEISMRLGSYNFYKPSLDIYGAINNSSKVAYRINTSYENTGSFRDAVKAERLYVNPSLLIKAGAKTEILLEGDYLHDNRTPDYGIGAINYVIANVPRNRFLGTAWAYNEVFQKSATATITHQLNQNWQLRGVSSYQAYNANLYSTTRPNASNNFVKPDGTWVRNLQRSATDEKYYLGQLDLTGKFNTGSLKHDFLVGSEVDRYRTNTTGFNIYADPRNPGKISTVYDTINIFNINEVKQRAAIPATDDTTYTKNPVNRMGFYIQDLIHITNKIKFLGGLRYSYMSANTIQHNLAPDGTLVPLKNKSGALLPKPAKRYDEAFTPRLGIVYQPFSSTAIFASYANSFTLNTGLDINFTRLAPSFINQYELGIKNDFLNGLLSANVTVYKIVNSNQAQAVLVSDIPADTEEIKYNRNNPQELGGTTASKGLEVDLMTKSFLGFSFLGGYSYNDTRFIKSSVNVEGSRLRYNPAHTANASLFYTVSNQKILNGLNAGFTAFYTGNRLAGRSTRTNVANDTWKLIPLPNYFQFDAHVGYTIDKLIVRLKVTNLLNELSYQAHDDNSINPIAPRQLMTTISYKF